MDLQRLDFLFFIHIFALTNTIYDNETFDCCFCNMYRFTYDCMY